MPKDNIQSNEIVTYRLDIIEKRIASIEKRLDALVTNNSGGSNEKINMELLNMLMSFIKTPPTLNSMYNTQRTEDIHNIKNTEQSNVDSSQPKNKNLEDELAARIYSMQRLSTV